MVSLPSKNKSVKYFYGSLMFSLSIHGLNLLFNHGLNSFMEIVN